MIKKITHITLFVLDQEEALRFYTEKLGFKVHTDADFEDMRWLTLTLPGQNDLELVLMLAETEDEEDLVGNQAGTKPLLSLQTDDCIKEYEKLKQLGVNFIDKPEVKPWGSSCSMQDLYGNIIYLCQQGSK